MVTAAAYGELTIVVEMVRRDDLQRAAATCSEPQQPWIR
jgi:hypothetical protein